MYLQRDQPDGVPPLSLTGERTLPDVPEENYWYRRHLVVYEWIAAQVRGVRVIDMASGEGYGADVLARAAASVIGVEANPEAFEHARLRYPAVRFERALVEQFTAPADAVVFLQTIEHLEQPGATLDHFASLLDGDGAVFLSTPNVLTLAPKGAARSDNPWHVHEYRPEEFEALCRAHFGRVEIFGLFHAAQAAPARAGAARRVGPGAPGARPDQALLRLVHAGDRRGRLRAAARRRGRHQPRVGPARRVPSVSSRRGGALAIVLHTHMPYVEGFGTWPFGEEWLWEALAGSYLPLLDLLDTGAPLTLSLTPVLCDQLEVPGVADRFYAFLEDVRRDTHARDAAGLRAGGQERLAAEVERAWSDYERAGESLRGRGGDLLSALAPHAAWTSAATHAILPLLATAAGVREQVRSGVRSHLRRFGAGWRGGFWLPECAYERGLEPVLREAGARAVCVELSERLGLGAGAPLRPLLADSDVLLVPVDRATMSLVWSDRGYPAAGAYRDYHHHTVHHHNPWGNDGRPYDHDAALALAGEHAADFVARTRERLERDGAELPGGGLAVCALDTELLGHWWYEGIAWLEAVVRECSAQGLELLRLDDALERCEPAPAPEGMGWPASSWGAGGDLSTWSGPQVAAHAFAARAAELDVLAAGRAAGPAAIRELMAMQASDWPFMVTRGIAVPYALERLEGHGRALQEALGEGDAAGQGGLRNLACDADPGAFFEPL